MIAASIRFGSIQYVSEQTSIKTGVAPTAAILSAVAKKVHETVITSSPKPIPNALKAKTRASVPLPQDIPYFAPSYSANSSSIFLTSSPPIYPPLRNTSNAASSYSDAYLSC